MKQIFFFILFSLGFLAAFIVPIKAATVSPALLDINVNPGQDYRGSIFIANEEQSEIILEGYIKSFKTELEKIHIIEESNRLEAMNWVELDQLSVILSPGEITEVEFSINVPKTAMPGGYYLMFLWHSQDQLAQNINLSSRIAVPLLLTVNGQLNQEIVAKDFVFNQEVGFLEITLKNNGNVHIQPQGKIRLINGFGLVREFLFNDEGRYILPGATRSFGYQVLPEQSFWSDWQREWALFPGGKIQVSLDLSDSGNSIWPMVVFWFWPWRLISIFSLILFLLLIIFWRRKRA